MSDSIKFLKDRRQMQYLRNQKRKVKGPNSHKKGGVPVYNNSTREMGLQPVLGPHRWTVLKYTDASDQRAFPGANYGVWSIRLNDVYDPDPLILTGGITGFPELSAFYSRWNVSRVSCKFTFTNRELFPLKIMIVLTPNSLVGTVGSRALAIDASERWGAIYTTELSRESGQDRASTSFTINPSLILGNKTYFTSGAFDGFNNGSPGSFVYVNFILVAPNGIGTIANGTFYAGTFSYKTKFYSIRDNLLGSKVLFAQALIAQRREQYVKGDVEGVNLTDLLIDELYSVTNLNLICNRMIQPKEELPSLLSVETSGLPSSPDEE